jgi:hypothetical protein
MDHLPYRKLLQQNGYNRHRQSVAYLADISR